MKIRCFSIVIVLAGLGLWLGWSTPNAYAQLAKSLPCPENVDDGVACTIDACDLLTSHVTHLPDNRRCEDSNVCTTNICEATGCKFYPLKPAEIDDGNACTKDICHPQTGVEHRPLAFDDHNVCTIDSCDPKEGVLHKKIDPKIETACSAGKGACLAEGSWECDAKTGEISCSAQAKEPTNESCDQIDNDCDGQVDDVAGLGEACSAGAGDCQVTGVLKCKSDGRLGCSAMAGDHSAETCDGIDNDCDDEIDESLTQSCFDGPGYARGVGICKTGKQICASGEWGVCKGAVQPASEEICENRLDDDCDGEVDEACEVIIRSGVGAMTTPPGGAGTAPATTVVVKSPAVTETAAVQKATPLPTYSVIVPPVKQAATSEVVVTATEQPVKITTTTINKTQTQIVEPQSTKETASATLTKVATETALPVKQPPTTETATLVKEPAPLIEPSQLLKILQPLKYPVVEPPIEPSAGQCRSEIFACEKTVNIWLPFTNLDDVGVLALAHFQDVALFEQQYLLVAGHNNNEAFLAYLAAKDFSLDGPVAFHTHALPESWNRFVITSLQGDRTENDLVFVSGSHRYGYILDMDQKLGAEGEILSTIPLLAGATADELVRNWRDGEADQVGMVTAVHQLKSIPMDNPVVKILGVVEVEGVQKVDATKTVVATVSTKTVAPAPIARILGLDVFNYSQGEVESRFAKLKSLGPTESIEAIRVEGVPHAEAMPPAMVVTVASNEGIEWYNCLLADEVSCQFDEMMVGIFPLVFSDERMISSEGEIYRQNALGSVAGQVRRGEELVEDFNPLGAKARAVLAELEPIGENFFLNTSEALVGYRLIEPTEEEAEVDFQVLDKEYLTATSPDEAVVFVHPTHPFPWMLDLFGGIDLVAFFAVEDAATKEIRGLVASFYQNKNEPPELELVSESANKLLVLARDVMADSLTCEATLQDEAGNDFSGLVIHADCEQVEIDLSEFPKEVERSVGKTSVNMPEASGSVTLQGEVKTTDPGKLSASKKFTVDASKGVVVTDESGEPVAEADAGGGAAEETTDGFFERVLFGVRGGGCGLVAARSPPSGKYLLNFLIYLLALFLFRTMLPSKF